MTREEALATISKGIRAFRQRKGYTQEELGRILGNGKANISQMEHGFSAPSIDGLFTLVENGMTAEEIFSVFQQRTFEEYGKNIPLKKGVKETLEALKTKGDRLFVLTASPNALIELSLKRLGVFDLFEETWSVEQFSWTKANKELFYEIAKKLA